MVHNNKKGFTLVELMVVISIIALMSSIVLAATTSARKQAQDSQVLSESQQVALAMELYRTSNNGYPNPISGASGLNQYSCIGGTNCMFEGTPITTKLSVPGFDIPNINTPVMPGQNQGFIYVSCSATTATCPDNTSYVITSTNQNGVLGESAGTWVISTSLPTLPSTGGNNNNNGSSSNGNNGNGNNGDNGNPPI